MWLWANDITASWGGVPNVTLSMMFICCPNLMFLASPWLEIYIFSIWSFYWLWAVQFDIYFANFGQIKIDTTCSTFDKKFQEPRIGSSTSHFQWFNQPDGIKNLVPQSNRLQQIFILSATRFLRSLRQNKICMIKSFKHKDTKSFAELRKYLMANFFFWQYC